MRKLLIMLLSTLTVIAYGVDVAYATEYIETEQMETEYTIYKIGDNTITKNVKESELYNYVNESYEWSLEPTTLMYAADGRTSWIWNSEVEAYSKVCWSTLPPTVIYSVNGERSVLVEEVEAYLSTGLWYLSPEEVPVPKKKTMNAFEKTNIPASELEKMLTRGLSGYGQAFYDMEQKYGINSVFAISVAELESGNGTSSAFRRKNNAFGIGPSKYFDSVESGINYFGQLMNKSTYYGKSIDKIGSIYCVGGNWAYKVKSLMRNNYACIPD